MEINFFVFSVKFHENEVKRDKRYFKRFDHGIVGQKFVKLLEKMA